MQKSAGTARDQWTIRGVYFDSAGWQLTGASETRMAWTGDFGGSMTLTKDAPAIGADQALDLGAARRDHRARAAERGGGLVSVEFVELPHGMTALEVITKHPYRSGYGFEGRLVIDANGERYTVQIVGDEEIRTGVRESIVNAVRMQRGEIDVLAMMSGPVDANGGRAIPGMKLDPYDSAYDAEATYAASDDPRIDVLLPKHPLSFIRATLQRVRSTWESGSGGAHTGSPRSAIPVSSGPKLILSDDAVRELRQMASDEPRETASDPVTAQAPRSGFDLRRLAVPLAVLGLMAIARGVGGDDTGQVIAGAGMVVAGVAIHMRRRPTI